jgi:hypothetical protein
MTDTFLYGGARATVALHERHLRAFLASWKRADAADLEIPAPPDDPDYVSRAVLLRHVLDCARGYLVWICEQLELPDPGIDPPPEADALATDPDAYLEHVLAGWQAPLTGVEPSRFYRPTYISRWNVEYCIDAMLEHAVMHPIRHAYQLDELLSARG